MFTTGLCYVWYVALSIALVSSGELNAFSSLTLAGKQIQISERLLVYIFLLTVT